MKPVLPLLVMSLLSASSTVLAQRSVGCFIAGREVDPCNCSRTCASRPSGPSREELERRRREEEAKRAAEGMHDANDRGVYEFQRRNWAAAIEYFRQALRDSPDDADILHNLRRAEEEQRKERARVVAAPPRPQPPATVAMQADARVAELARIADSLSRFESEYRRNPATAVRAQRENIEAILKVLATQWLVGAPAAREAALQETKDKVRAELERALKESIQAMLTDVKRLRPFEWDSPSRAAEKRDVVRQSMEEINRLSPQALAEASDLRTTSDGGSYQLRFNSGPALRGLENINRAGRWRNYDAK